MSQSDFGSLSSPLPGQVFFKDNLEPWRDALHSLHKGDSRPSYAVAGTMWIDDTTTPWLLKIFGGADDVVLGEVNASTGEFIAANVSAEGVSFDPAGLDVIAPGSDNVDLALRDLDGAIDELGGASGIAENIDVLTSSGTYVVPEGVTKIRVTVVGGGGSSFRADNTGTGSSGGTTSFSSLSATGGDGGTAESGNLRGGAGGLGSGGIINFAGGAGGSGTSWAASNYSGGAGGDSFFGGGGQGASSTGATVTGQNGRAFGGGGGGGVAASRGSGGGGGGGCSIGVLDVSPDDEISYTIGAGGSISNAANGSAGVIIVEYLL